MADLQETVGVVIRRERRARRMTLKELAERAALSLVYLGEIERGKKYPSALVLERLSEALGLDVSDLLETVAADLRAAIQPEPVQAIGIALPAPARVPSRTTSGMLDMMATGAVLTYGRPIEAAA